MRCQAEKLSALVDGDLSPRAAARVRRHLAECARCQSELAGLEQLRASLGALGEDEPDAPDVWLRLAQRLAVPAPPRRMAWRWPALAVGALTAAALLLGARRQLRAGPSDDAIIAEAEHEFRSADAEYLRAIEKLRGVTAHARSGWPEARRREYDTAQAALDAATERCQGVARARPADAEAEALLFAAYRKQIDFFEEQLWRSR
jgi:hypothetical protein